MSLRHPNQYPFSVKELLRELVVQARAAARRRDWKKNHHLCRLHDDLVLRSRKPTLVNLADRMLTALTSGERGLRTAWVMALATYSYTRSWHGAEGPDGEPMEFSRWYCFASAAEIFWEYLWKRKHG